MCFLGHILTWPSILCLLGHILTWPSILSYVFKNREVGVVIVDLSPRLVLGYDMRLLRLFLGPLYLHDSQ